MEIKTFRVQENSTSLRDSGSRVSQFSYIRAISCFAIVLLHCLNTSRAYYEKNISDIAYSSVVTSCSLLMWAVPCFLMVTGALLLDPSRIITPGKLFGKYIRRMITALLVFTFIFTLIKYISGDMQGSTSFIEFFLTNLIRDEAMPHLWYLYLMIVLYLLIPLLKIIVRKLSKKTLWIITAAMVIAAAIFTFADTSSFWQLPWSLGSIVYPAYLLIGHSLYSDNVNPKTAIIALGLSTITIAACTWAVSQTALDVFAVSSYSSPLVVIQSAAFFSLMLRIKAKEGKWIDSIDGCSFGIYLIHMIFVRLTMKELGFNPYSYGPFAFLPMAIIFFCISYAISYFIKRFSGSAIV